MGYYYNSNECINLLRKCKVRSVYGNHEKIFFETKKSKNYRNFVKENMVMV